MKNNNNINIVVASDDFYAILIAALLKSIDVNHNTGEHIDFHIIDDGISAKFRRQLETMVDPERITLKWFKGKDVLPADVTLPIDNSAFPLTTYLRIFAPYIIDQDADKMIYLDVDTIVQDDISKLWNMALGEYAVGAILDIAETVDSQWGGLPNYKELGLDPKTKYFNAGVLLIDPKKWREENISGQIIDALTKHRKHNRLVDQYGLNVALANKWQELDPKWNWAAVKENDNPSLIHFLDIKPIFKNYNSKEIYKQEFFRYLSMTPWKNFKLISGNRRNFRKLMNKIKKKLMQLFR
ncbi:MAG: glycosyltransferase family 8 protein [Mucilaginibacter sp.]